MLAVEPEPYLRRHAERAAAAAPVPIRVVAARAESLPAADGSFDAGVVSLVLCSVAEPDRALRELHRVVRPGGELRAFEHVRSGHPLGARVQDALDPVWSRLAGGCHAGRDTTAAIVEAGFRLEDLRRFRFPPGVPTPTTPHVRVRARRPPTTVAAQPGSTVPVTSAGA
ncbi:MAG: hypothetical protein AVDCRST_MAG79-484 [uncultured Thermoleophilia bacterium]|uniref:Methyltransferase type 11 domain-containing protein n=1 Tax=uncultured Thermoleophilia bacterium TaxID=1497501 RepID=A0A6J4TJH0_9ACTN|nr:MAG: hypothetical protein AVDCRST_MAG79-484 [uncultured Thermoleophilia bacterium]